VLPLYDARLRLTRPHLAVRWWVVEQRVLRWARRALDAPITARVTVILPTYKRGDLLLRAVDSVLQQTFGDFHVLVIDDGGGDVPPLPEDPRLTVLRLPENVGHLGVINNVGIQLTRSPYIALLNDDNEWRPQHLEVSVPALDAGAELVYTAMTRVTEEGDVLDVLAEPYDRTLLRKTSYIDSNTISFRREPRKRFSRIPRMKLDFPAEDWEFVWRVTRRRPATFVPVNTVQYLVNTSSYFTPWGASEASDRQ
jgi:glycosyltransferase involved in cell wall biosynthesis